MGFSILESALEAALVRPCHLAFAVHLVIMEVTLIGLSGVDEIVFTLSLELSIDKVAFIHVTVIGVLALASLLSLGEVAGVFALAAVPSLLSFSFLLIVDPLAVVQ